METSDQTEKALEIQLKQNELKTKMRRKFGQLDTEKKNSVTIGDFFKTISEMGVELS